VRTNLARNEVEFGVEPEESEFYSLAYDPYDESKDPDTVLNWKTKIPWNAKWEYEMDDEEKGVFRAVNSVYYQGSDKYDGRQLNAHKMIYSYKWVNYQEAARAGNTFNSYTAAYNDRASVTVDSMYMENGRIVDTVITKQLTTRGDLITRRILNIYPDTMCWMTEFAYSYNEPAMMNYFSHPSYGQFPVVGITWNQAEAFANWRTDLHKNAGGLPMIHKYRLPSEAEWEYAARGDRHEAMYPWGGPYVRDSKGCFMANFKPMRGNYVEDGYLIPSQVGSFEPNDYGLFDMSGNVSEWTSTVYDNALNAYTLDMNPSYEYNSKKTDPKILKLKIVKGGSWKDIYAYLQCGARDKEYEDICRPSIGFRCVRSFIGT
jgi:gliding motility-associated lipoprotein GldK